MTAANNIQEQIIYLKQKKRDDNGTGEDGISFNLHKDCTESVSDV